MPLAIRAEIWRDSTLILCRLPFLVARRFEAELSKILTSSKVAANSLVILMLRTGLRTLTRTHSIAPLFFALNKMCSFELSHSALTISPLKSPDAAPAAILTDENTFEISTVVALTVSLSRLRRVHLVVLLTKRIRFRFGETVA